MWGSVFKFAPTCGTLWLTRPLQAEAPAEEDPSNDVVFCFGFAFGFILSSPLQSHRRYLSPSKTLHSLRSRVWFAYNSSASVCCRLGFSKPFVCYSNDDFVIYLFIFRQAGCSAFCALVKMVRSWWLLPFGCWEMER